MYRPPTSIAILSLTALLAAACGGGTSGEKDTTPPTTGAAPAGGTYDAAQDVVLACDDGDGRGCDATYYTLDGSDPDTSSSSYTAPIAIAADTELRFFSTDLAGNAEAVQSEVYTIESYPDDTSPPATSAAPAGGTYNTAQDVVLACDDGDGSGCDATYYTLDGSDPDTSSSSYTAPIVIEADTELKFFSTDLAGNAEAVQSEEYIVDPDPPTTSAMPAGGAFDSAREVVLSCDDGGGTGCDATYYTLDGSDPDTSSSSYTAPIAIAADTELKFFSTDLAGNAEDIRIEHYFIDLDPPQTAATPPGGLYHTAQDVTLACDDGTGTGCQATYYTLDGSDPTTASQIYSGPLAIASDTTLKFFSVDGVGRSEDIQTEGYTFDFDAPVTTVDPPGGTYNQAQNVALSCDDGAGSGCAGIYYTLDGSDPTTASPYYIDPIPIAVDTTLRFFAADLAGNAETIQTEEYVIVAANWEAIGPYGGSVRGVAFDPDTPATAFVATQGGVFKTVDTGAHWAAVNQGLSTKNATAVAVDPFDPDRLFAATSGGGAFRSEDGGITWSPLSGITDLYMGAFSCDPAADGVVYAAGGDNVFKSVDSGDNWTVLDTGSAHANFQCIAAIGGTVYVGTWEDGVFKSTNAGADWAPASNNLAGASVYAFAVDPVDSDRVFAATRTAGVQMTVDGGTNWEPANAGLPDSSILSLLMIDADTLYAGSGQEGVYRTVDGGASWLPAGTGMDAGTSVRALAVQPGDPATLLAATSSQGLYKSTDSAASWSRSEQGIHALSITALLIDPLDSDILWAATSTNGVYKSTDGGNQWMNMSQGLGSLQLYSLALDTADPDRVFAGTTKGVHKSTDGGSNWVETYGGPWGGIHALVVDPVSSDVLYAGTSMGVYKSTDGGDNWQSSSSGLTGTSVRAIVIDPTDTDVLYAAGAPCTGVFRSIDGGSNWTALATGLDRECFWSMIMDPGDSQTLYASDREMAKTSDAGATWAVVGTGLPFGTVRGMAFTPDGSRLYAGHSYEGVYYSDDDGATWNDFNDNLGMLVVNKVAVDPAAPGLVYAGTEAGSVWVYR